MAVLNEMSDIEILTALRAGGAAREAAWKFMYLKWRGIWLRQILSMGGTADEAHEAHDDVFWAFEKAVTAPDFQLHSAKLSTYLVRCVVRRWAKNTSRRPRMEEIEDRHVEGFTKSVEEEILREECQKLLDEVLGAIGPRCKKILTLWAEGYSGDETAAMMGFSGGAETAKNEVYKCKEKIKTHLEKHPKIKTSLEDCR